MKPAIALVILTMTLSGVVALAAPIQGNPGSNQPAGPNLDAIIGQIRQASQSANADIGRLQIDRWKGDGGGKAAHAKIPVKYNETC